MKNSKTARSNNLIGATNAPRPVDQSTRASTAKRPEPQRDELGSISVTALREGVLVWLNGLAHQRLLRLDRASAATLLEIVNRKLDAANGMGFAFSQFTPESIAWSPEADDCWGLWACPRELILDRGSGTFYLLFTDRCAAEPFVRVWLNVATLRALFWEVREILSAGRQLGDSRSFIRS